MGEDGAACFRMFSTDTREIGKEAWDVERFGMICSRAESFADLKKAILKLCAKTRICDYETKALVERFGARIENAVSQSQKRGLYAKPNELESIR